MARVTRRTAEGMAEARRQLERQGADRLDDAALLGIALGGDGELPLQMAARLLRRVGGVGGLMRVGAAELIAEDGIGDRRAASLLAARELVRRGLASWPDASWVVRTPADVGDRLVTTMGPLEREELRVLLLNTKNVVQAMVTVYLGNLGGSSVRVAEVYRDAVRRLAAAVVVAHNHPSGDPTPSADDLKLTRELARAGDLLDIALLDHLVIGAGRWVSLRSMGAMG